MTLISLFLALVLNSFFCVGVHILFTFENMPFKPIGDWFTLMAQERYWITKPLYNCLPCMASVYGCLFFSLMFGFTWVVLPYCIALCGFNYYASKLLYYGE